MSNEPTNSKSKHVMLTPDEQEALMYDLKDMRRRFDLLSSRLDDIGNGIDDLLSNWDIANWDKPRGKP